LHAAAKSDLAGLRAGLDGLGFACYQLDGSRIVDRISFQEETVRAGILDDWLARSALPDRSAILWVHAARFPALAPAAFVEAVHALLEGDRYCLDFAVFLVGQGPLVQPPRVASLAERRASSDPSDEDRIELFMITLGFNCGLLKMKQLWSLELE